MTVQFAERLRKVKKILKNLVLLVIQTEIPSTLILSIK